MDESLYEFVYSCGCEAEFATPRVSELNKMIEAEATKRTEKMVDERFIERKKEFQLEVLKQVQEEGIRKEGLKISASSPLISETYTVDGIELNTSCFIPESIQIDPLYEEKQLIKNAYSLEWQEQNKKTGQRKFAALWNPIAVLIQNPKGIGSCENIIVAMKGEKTPLIFPHGDISYEEFRRQTRFARKGINVSTKVIYESFLRAIRECPCKRFLTIPKHAGWVKLQSGEITYISSESLISGLEELFPVEVREHKLVPHALPIEEIAALYRKAIPDSMESKLLTTIRIESCLLPFFEAERLHPDKGFVIVYNSEPSKESCIALTKRQNYKTTVTSSISERITRIRTYFETANDSTVVLSSSGVIDDSRSINNGLKEVYEDLNRTNGKEDSTRKLFVLLTDSLGNFPEEFPVYYITCELSFDTKNIEVIQRFAGMLDYALIKYAERNPDTIKHLVHDGIHVARNVVSTLKEIEVTDTLLMILATAQILMKLGIVAASDLRAIIRWCMTGATLRSTMTDTICCEFKSAVSEAILSGELKIAKQVGPPYYSDNDNMAFIAETDKSLNMNDEVLKKIIIPKTSTRSFIKMNKQLKQKGWLKSTHNNKRKLKVAFDAGILDDVEVFSYSRAVLNVESKLYVDDVINNEFWFNVGEYPKGFVPILYNADGTRAAGYVFSPDDDDNLHEEYFGTTRSGKTFALVNRAIQKVVVEGADAVIIFDQTGGFSPAEVDKHVSKELRMKYFLFWNVYSQGIPVDLLDLRGCLTLKDERERILRIYAMMTRMLGSYQEQILKIAVNCMLRQMKRCPDMKLADILKFIEAISYNDDGKLGMDEAHRKLYLKLKSVIEDFEGTPIHNDNWGEFVEKQGKSIIIISTGADSVGKGSEVIDALLESIYTYKQSNPDSKYTVIIDEAEDLYLHEKGAVNTILRKSGKHGVTMLLASQAFPDPTTAFGKVVGNCSRVRGYRSKGDDLTRYADRFGCDKYEADSLQQGNCYDNGPFYSRYCSENVITTLKGKTLAFEPAPELNDNTEEDEEQP